MIVSGSLFGIRLYSDGVIVSKFASVITEEGEYCPAKESGIKVGDRIVGINGHDIKSNNELTETIDGDKCLDLDIVRGEDTLRFSVTPIFDGECYRLGMWVRDSAAGIGTITYYDPDTGEFAGLGHGICDVDSETLMTLEDGEPADVTVMGIETANAGDAGRIKGFFSSGASLGFLTENRDTGIYGKLYSRIEGQEAEIASNEEIFAGEAEIIAEIDNRGPKRYSVEIESISSDKTKLTKNMVIHVTDKELIRKTGGIIQGMSGCPILQNGKLIGAVTHVFLDDSSRGFAIFAENMYKGSE